jgi:hypothetical protein
MQSVGTGPRALKPAKHSPLRALKLKQALALIMLRRFSTAGRWCEYEMEFGTTRKRLKPLFDCAVNHMLDHHRHLNYNAKMWRPHSPTYAAALSAKNSPLRACVGFVDGTVLPIAKPTRNERGCYDGKNRCHALKFQSLCLANGMIGHFYGPECGGVHDSTMMGRSQLLHQFESCCGAPNQPNHYYMFGDPAYVRLDTSSSRSVGRAPASARDVSTQRWPRCASW